MLFFSKLADNINYQLFFIGGGGAQKDTYTTQSITQCKTETINFLFCMCVLYTLYRSHNGCMLYLLLIIFCVVSYPCFRLFIIITAVYCILRAIRWP